METGKTTDDWQVLVHEKDLLRKRRALLLTYLPMDMTYLGSGIWSYTCWKEDAVQSVLYNVWLRSNLSFQLEESLMPVYQSCDRLVIIQPAFKQLYCSQRPHPADRKGWERVTCNVYEQETRFIHSFSFMSQTWIKPETAVGMWFGASFVELHKKKKKLISCGYIPTVPSLTFRRAGAILLVSVPATIMTSACRGLALNTTPKRSMS